MRLCPVLVLLLCPYVSQAAIQISEVAWMGGIESANHEWIELYNPSGPTAVDGWILHDANNLTIELSGTIAAGDRVVLERTSDVSAAGAAFMIYTGALNNSGATLVLRDDDGTVVDQVAGGENWENIGGDNETKATAQLRSGQWVTAAATPGSDPKSDVANPTDTVGTEVKSDATQSTADTPQTSDTRSTNSSSGEATVLTLPDITLQLTIDVPNKIHIGQPVTMTVEPSGVGDTIANSLSYTWSLGNGVEKTGQDITYTYNHPGRYVIVVAGEYKRQKQFARQTVEVLPVHITLSKTAAGNYQINNTSDQEVDVGGYRLVGHTTHTFPQHTIILPQASVVTPVKVTNHANAVVGLYDSTEQAMAMHLPNHAANQLSNQPTSNEVVQLTVLPNSPSTPVTALSGAGVQTPAGDLALSEQAKYENENAIVPPPPNPNQPPSNFGFAADTTVGTPGTNQPQPSPARVQTQPHAQLAAVAIPPNPLSDNWPTFALISLLILGIIGIYLVPQKKDSAPWD